MAKALRMYWNLVKSILTCTVGKDGKEIFAGDLMDLFPDWNGLTECQREAIAYGVKQKLSDSLARPADATLNESEKAIELEKNWRRISMEGEWNAKPTALTPLEKAERKLAAFEKEVEGYITKLKEDDTPDEVIDGIVDKIWEPKLAELRAEVAKLS